MNETMKEFEKNKLKNKVIHNRKQAIAIGLNRVEDKCSYTKNEYVQLEKNLKEFLSSKVENKISLSKIIETRKLIEYYFKNKNYSKCKKFEAMLWYYILSAVSENIEITDKIWNEIKAIKKMDFVRF
jgi:hypothetical protein